MYSKDDDADDEEEKFHTPQSLPPTRGKNRLEEIRERQDKERKESDLRFQNILKRTQQRIHSAKKFISTDENFSPIIHQTHSPSSKNEKFQQGSEEKCQIYRPIHFPSDLHLQCYDRPGYLSDVIVNYLYDRKEGIVLLDADLPLAICGSRLNFQERYVANRFTQCCSIQVEAYSLNFHRDHIDSDIEPISRLVYQDDFQHKLQDINSRIFQLCLDVAYKCPQQQQHGVPCSSNYLKKFYYLKKVKISHLNHIIKQQVNLTWKFDGIDYTETEIE